MIWFKATTRSARAKLIKILRILPEIHSNFVQKTPPIFTFADRTDKTKSISNPKEAKARIKINNLLERADWRFFDNEANKANIALRPNVKIAQKDIDAFGKDFEFTKNGFIDFLLPDENGALFIGYRCLYFQK